MNSASSVSVQPISATPLIEVRHVTKRFPGVVAIDDVSLTLGRGEVLAVIGDGSRRARAAHMAELVMRMSSLTMSAFIATTTTL